LKRNYDTIASFYDKLARLVYGRTLINAQLFLLHAIPANSNILIAGGGTGWILEELAKIYPSGLDITYIDSSVKMITLARARNVGANNVDFVAAPVETLPPGKQYDAILTPFLLDNFTDEKLEGIFPFLHSLLRPGGLWLYCDFQNTGRLWQKGLLKLMYFFFRIFCGIGALRLPDAESCFRKYRYSILDEKKFMSDFVIAAIYKRVLDR